MIRRKTVVRNGFIGEKPDPAAFLERWRAAIRQMEEKRILSPIAPALTFPEPLQNRPAQEKEEQS